MFFFGLYLKTMTFLPLPCSTTFALAFTPSDLDAGVVCHEQNVEFDFSVHLCIQLFDENLVAGFDLVLLSTGLNDCIHSAAPPLTRLARAR